MMMMKPLLLRRNDDYDGDWSLLYDDDEVVVVVVNAIPVNIGTTRRVAASRAYASYSKDKRCPPTLLLLWKPETTSLIHYKS